MRSTAGSTAGIVLALAAAVGVGCNPFVPTVCTDIGCVNGLALRFDAPLPEGTVVTLDTGGAPLTVRCTAGSAPCGDLLLIEGLRAESVTVRVETPAGTAEEFFRPRYSTSRPNGPDCPTECWHATIEFTLPVGSGDWRG